MFSLQRASLRLAIVVLALIVTAAVQGADSSKVSSRAYSADRTTVAEVSQETGAVAVYDVNGGGKRTTLTRFGNTVRGAEFYQGRQVLVVTVGGPSAGLWPEFFERNDKGEYTRLGLPTEEALPEMVSTALPKGFEWSRMWIHCYEWREPDIATIKAVVRTAAGDKEYNEPFVFLLDVRSGKIWEWLSRPEATTRNNKLGRMLTGGGTGFFVDHGGLIVTAKHVVEHENDIEVVDSKGRQSRATVAALGTDDVALLKVDTDAPAIVPTHSSDKPPALGTPLYTVGFPQNLEHGGQGSIEFSEGVLSAYNAGQGVRQFQFSAPIRPGNSGSGIINTQGDLVGVAVAGYDPVRVFAATGHTAVLANLGEWTEAVLLLLPAGWSQADPPVIQNHADAIANLQAATVEVLLFKTENTAATSGGLPKPSAVRSVGEVPPAVPSSQQQLLRAAQEADRHMAEAYTAVRGRLNVSEKAKLKSLQLDWLKARAAAIGSKELLSQGLAASPVALQKFIEMNQARARALRELLGPTN